MVKTRKLADGRKTCRNRGKVFSAKVQKTFLGQRNAVMVPKIGVPKTSSPKENAVVLIIFISFTKVFLVTQQLFKSKSLKSF